MSDPARLVVLLQLVASGDSGALKSLYDLTSAKLFGVCLRGCNDRQAAEEVLQDVYIKVWRKAGYFDPGKASAITWLCTIARNTAIDWRRSTGAIPLTTSYDDTMAALADEPAYDVIAGNALRHHILHCIDRLERNQGQAVRIAFYEGLTHSELSVRLNVPLGTLKSWIRRAMIALRECVDHD